MARLADDLGAALASLEEQLVFFLALKKSQSFRRSVLAGADALVMEVPHEAGWGLLSSESFTVVRDRPVASPTFSKSTELFRSADLSPYRRAVTPQAERLICSLLVDDRAAFTELWKWMPLVEPSLYAIAARISGILDEIRPRAISACEGPRKGNDEIVLSYRKLVATFARATLLSTDAGFPWLTGVADSFAWRDWTPSFRLIMERDLWSAAIGMRAASRFGPAVIDRYLDAFRRARHPLLAVDALGGLAAIGTFHPTCREMLIKALETEHSKLSVREMPHLEIVLFAYEQARRQLTDPINSPLPLARPRQDALGLDPSGQMPLFKYASSAIETPVFELIPPSHRKFPLNVHAASMLVSQAWVRPGSDAGSDVTWVAGHA